MPRSLRTRIFQSTFPRGERRIFCCIGYIFCNFNPRSRVGNDGGRTLWQIPLYGFQSTFPRGERLRSTLLNTVLNRYFNPRSRVGNDCRRTNKACALHNFNPRSRVGNDGTQPVCSASPQTISIHVPAWGTTFFWFSSSFFLFYFNPRSRVGNDSDDIVITGIKVISIHVPAWGTTGFTSFRCSASVNFNPRSRVGNDSSAQYRLRSFSMISIHVPAWGTTYGILWDIDTPENFNPRSRVGNDMSVLSMMQDIEEFQSTFPRGERQLFDIRNLRICLFQSTFPRGERRFRHGCIL